eukprot:NODE_11958_length_395_cov_3.231214_g10815_i0.p2 GENE.NODE_11958_length_395_cov_3.231214_g10815_i0~~NODE_11958_length_395_cov_3.231214_g10815_i0.p2  ORF type:complete len:84 (+),score=5.87 NODE_11958_length_395_cov_3.231214_g10815_i0:103-354(+)
MGIMTLTHPTPDLQSRSSKDRVLDSTLIAGLGQEAWGGGSSGREARRLWGEPAQEGRLLPPESSGRGGQTALSESSEGLQTRV